MVLLGTHPLGEYPIGGYIVFIGDISGVPYTPDFTYIDSNAFKATWGTMDSNYLVYADSNNYYPSNDVFWNPYNQNLGFSFEVMQQTTETSFDFGFNFYY